MSIEAIIQRFRELPAPARAAAYECLLRNLATEAEQHWLVAAEDFVLFALPVLRDFEHAKEAA